MDIVRAVDLETYEEIVTIGKYPKTDYTYSSMSRDRVELAPGQVAVPNMSRRSLTQFRVQGPNEPDEPDKYISSWTTTTTRKRFTMAESSDDESSYIRNGYAANEKSWWFTEVLASIFTAIRTSARNAQRKIFGPSHRYPYTDRRPAKAGITATVASAPAALLYWIYTLITTVVTTTITTVTETISPNKIVSEKYRNASHKKQSAGKWKLLPILLLLAAFGYCYYNYNDEAIIGAYTPPMINQDAELAKRIAALETWAINVDNRFKYIDDKLSRIDNLEIQIEQYSLKNLQQNLIQILSVNSEDVAAKLKGHLDKHYMSKDEMQILSQQIHERLIHSWKPDMGEGDIRRLVQEYLLTVEQKQMTLIVEKVKEFVGSVAAAPAGGDDHTYGTEEIRKLVSNMLEVYDADKTGLVDFALESAGGQVISTRCTELYQIKTKQYSILGLPVWWVYTSPRYALTPGNMPAECWAFQGFPGYLVLRTYAIIEVTGFSLEHMSRLLAAEGKIESAPRNFSVYGLHGELDPEPHLFGNYLYDANSTAIQYFPVQYPKTTNIAGKEYPVAYDIVELRIESNHGNPTYTCVYRFRVHGNPLNDIRQATEDSIRDSET